MDLSNACQRGDHAAVMEYLATTRLSVNSLFEIQRRQCTALHHAAEFGHLKIVKELIHYGANPNIKSSEERLPLHYACVGGHHEIARCLIPLTHDLNTLDKNGQSAAHISCYQGETQCLEMLMDENADLTIKDGNQRSCIELTLISDHSETLNLLLQRKPELAGSTSCNGQTPIHYAGKFDAVKCLNVFKRHRFDLSVTDLKGISPVHVAAMHGNVRALKYLLKSCVSIDLGDGMNRQILHFAARSNTLACLHWVAQQTTDVSAVDAHGNTAAHYVTSAEALNCLLRHGADLDIENENGDTPFYCARKAGFPVAFQKALTGEISCPLCNVIDEKSKSDEAHKPSIIEQKISSNQVLLYEARERTTKKPSRKPLNNNQKQQFLPKRRDLSARFYGPEIFVSSVTTTMKSHGPKHGCSTKVSNP